MLCKFFTSGVGLKCYGEGYIVSIYVALNSVYSNLKYLRVVPNYSCITQLNDRKYDHLYKTILITRLGILWLKSNYFMSQFRCTCFHP